MATRRCVMLNAADDVAVLLEDGHVGDQVQAGGRFIELRDEIPRFHKVCVRPLEPGQEVKKMGEIIGLATERIDVGMHVHVRNVRSARKGK